ncbi:ABC transporter permease [Streptomyces pseudoechinosporeus]
MRRLRSSRSRLSRWWPARVAGAVLVLLAVSVLVFAATEAAPGDAATARLGPQASAGAVDALRAELGLDRPAPVRYLDWLGHVVRGDFGASYANGRPVAELVADRFGNSLVLGLAATAVLVPLAIGLGLWAGLRAGRRGDRIVSGGALGLAAVPEFVTGAVLMAVFAAGLGWLPAVSLLGAGQSPLDEPAVLVLPVLTLVSVCLAQNLRLVRTGVAEAARSPAVEAARLNGVPERRVALRYVLPAGVGPAIPMFARSITYLLGGALVAESLFGYPGLAALLVDATAARDAPVVQAVALLGAAVAVAANLAADLAVPLLEPVQRHQR